MPGENWERWEDEIILANQHKSYREIAEDLNRTPNAVKCRGLQLGIRKRFKEGIGQNGWSNLREDEEYMRRHLQALKKPGERSEVIMRSW